jgi:hypothetical protein
VTAREHSPKPGVAWQQQPARVETVVGNEPDEPSTTVGGGNEPWPPLVNRADRRRDKRAQRKRGRS